MEITNLNTVSWLTFDDENEPFKDLCGNIWTSGNPDSTPVIEKSKRLLGSGSLHILPNSYIETPCNFLDINSREFTIEFWLYFVRGQEERGSFISVYGNAIVINYNRIYFNVEDIENEYSVRIRWGQRRWYHVALVKYNGFFTTYVDGWRVAYCYVKNQKLFTDDMYVKNIMIGHSCVQTESNNYDYYIDEVRISNKALYKGERFNALTSLGFIFPTKFNCTKDTEFYAHTRFEKRKDQYTTYTHTMVFPERFNTYSHTERYNEKDMEFYTTSKRYIEKEIENIQFIDAKKVVYLTIKIPTIRDIKRTPKPLPREIYLKPYDYMYEYDPTGTPNKFNIYEKKYYYVENIINLKRVVIDDQVIKKVSHEIDLTPYDMSYIYDPDDSYIEKMISNHDIVLKTSTKLQIINENITTNINNDNKFKIRGYDMSYIYDPDDKYPIISTIDIELDIRTERNVQTSQSIYEQDQINNTYKIHGYDMSYIYDPNDEYPMNIIEVQLISNTKRKVETSQSIYEQDQSNNTYKIHGYDMSYEYDPNDDYPIISTIDIELDVNTKREVETSQSIYEQDQSNNTYKIHGYDMSYEYDPDDRYPIISTIDVELDVNTKREVETSKSIYEQDQSNNMYKIHGYDMSYEYNPNDDYPINTITVQLEVNIIRNVQTSQSIYEQDQSNNTYKIHGYDMSYEYNPNDDYPIISTIDIELDVNTKREIQTYKSIYEQDQSNNTYKIHGYDMSYEYNSDIISINDKIVIKVEISTKTELNVIRPEQKNPYDIAYNLYGYNIVYILDPNVKNTYITAQLLQKIEPSKIKITLETSTQLTIERVIEKPPHEIKETEYDKKYIYNSI